MLSVNPKSRPTISTILEKPFIRKRVTSYIYDFMQIYKNDKNLEADDVQCDILKVQAEKLGVFNFIVKEINNFNNANNCGINSGSGNNQLNNLQSFNIEELQNNIHTIGVSQLKYNSNEKTELNTSNERNKISYLKYLKKKQEEKKKIEEKIAELEKQKKNIAGKAAGRRNSKINNKNSKSGSSVEKLKLKDSFAMNMNPSAGRIKRPDSTNKPSRKISHESEHSPVRDEIVKFEPNSNIELFSYKNYEYENKNNYKSNHKLEPLYDVEQDEKFIRISQEIEKMKEQLEKTQIKICKVEKKLTSREGEDNFKDKDLKSHDAYDLENNIEEYVELTDSEDENCEIAYNRGLMSLPSENEDEGVLKIKERIKFFKQ